MKRTRTLFRLLPALLLLLLFAAGCSKDVVTDSIMVQYGTIELWNEKPATGAQIIRGKITVRITNRTEKSLKIGAEEGSFYDPRSKTAIARFRPIIPNAYGTMSEVDLLPKQTKEWMVETPPDLQGINVAATPNVVVKLSFTTSDGYRTDVTSAEVPVGTR